MNANFDDKTIVTFSLMVYYIPQVAAGTGSIQDFVDHQIAKLNQGYINSKIPVRAKLHCLQELVYNETLKMDEKVGKLDLPSNTADGIAIFGKNLKLDSSLKSLLRKFTNARVSTWSTFKFQISYCSI